MKFKHVDPSVYGCDRRRITSGKNIYIHSPGMKEVYGADLGKHLGEFIQDPPIPIDNPSHWGLNAQGVSIIPDTSTGVYNAWDWIGKDSYPNPSDIWMQAIFKDDNALVPITKDLQLLTEFESKRILVHPNGHVKNMVTDIKQARLGKIGITDECFLPEGEYRDLHIAPMSEQYCSALWWQTCKGKKHEDDPNRVTVEVGDFTYEAGLVVDRNKLEFQLAVIGWLWISELHLVVGNMKENPSDINDAIDAAVALLDSMNLNLPVYATDH